MSKTKPRVVPIEAATTTENAAARSATARHDDLRQMLEDRRREGQQEVHSRIREVRGATETLDTGEDSESDIQRDLELALLQMKAETLIRIEGALTRLEAGAYGSCSDCEAEISEKRLRALPFALRCRNCEETRETHAARERQGAEDRNAPTLFPGTAGY